LRVNGNEQLAHAPALHPQPFAKPPCSSPPSGAPPHHGRTPTRTYSSESHTFAFPESKTQKVSCSRNRNENRTKEMQNTVFMLGAFLRIFSLHCPCSAILPSREPRHSSQTQNSVSTCKTTQDLWSKLVRFLGKIYPLEHLCSSVGGTGGVEIIIPSIHEVNRLKIHRF
jgi:hypothetical protein